jgi:hypothetical protein
MLQLTVVSLDDGEDIVSIAKDDAMVGVADVVVSALPAKADERVAPLVVLRGRRHRCLVLGEPGQRVQIV